MKLTHRGRIVGVIVALTLVLGWQFGARSLNAVGAPLLAALFVEAIVVRRMAPPGVELSSLDPGFPGERRALTMALSGSGVVTVSFPFSEGLDGDSSERTVTLPETMEYDIELVDRGFYHLGPPIVSQRGPLGLVEQAVDPEDLLGWGVVEEETTELAVYPQLYSFPPDLLLSEFFADEFEAERQEFDRLREYTPGDPLRHVHWKSSAKHDEFLVMEFAPSERSETVTIAGSASSKNVDEMARTVATIADLALEAGFNVEVAVPDGEIPPGKGSAHRENVLWLLARTDGGPSRAVPANADILVEAGQRETKIGLVDTETTLAELHNAGGTSDRRPSPTDSTDTEVTA
jgi:uncharacterized protein (DUF58 family)